MFNAVVSALQTWVCLARVSGLLASARTMCSITSNHGNCFLLSSVESGCGPMLCVVLPPLRLGRLLDTTLFLAPGPGLLPGEYVWSEYSCLDPERFARLNAL